MSLGSGAAQWRRLALGVGPAYRLTPTPKSPLEAEGTVLLALLAARGENFQPNYNSLEADVGLSAGLRLAVGDWHWFPALHVGVRSGPGATSSTFWRPIPGTSLPQLEFLGGLELGFRSL